MDVSERREGRGEVQITGVEAMAQSGSLQGEHLGTCHVDTLSKRTTFTQSSPTSKEKLAQRFHSDLTIYAKVACR